METDCIITVLPSIRAVAFAVPLFAQAYLLVHPNAAKPLFARIRFLLMFIIVFLAFTSPFLYQFEPIAYSVGANFRYGIFGPFFTLKAIEWGLATDLSPYQWLGFLNSKTIQTLSNVQEKNDVVKAGALGEVEMTVETEVGSTRVGNKITKEMAKKKARKSVSVVQTGLNALHLMTSFRGVGYGFAPPSLLEPRERKTAFNFFFSTLFRFMIAHLSSTAFICLIVSNSLRLSLLSVLQIVLRVILPFPNLPNLPFSSLSLFIQYVCVGLSLHSNMNVGMEGTSLLYLVINLSARAILPKNSSLRPAKFDSREFPPLFSPTVHLPFNGVGSFWRDQWHSLFARVFTSIGYYPVNRLFGKRNGKILSLFTVFAISAWFHQQAFYSANWHLPPRNLTLLQSQGANFFFLVQPIAILLEGMFSKVTGRKISGPFGLLWSYLIIVGFGCVAAQSWLAQGLVDGVCDPSLWSIERFLIPNLSLLPC